MERRQDSRLALSDDLYRHAVQVGEGDLSWGCLLESWCRGYCSCCLPCLGLAQLRLLFKGVSEGKRNTARLAREARAAEAAARLQAAGLAN